MQGLIIDPFAGISGDMFLGALVDLGLPVEAITRLVDALDVGVRIGTERVDRAGIRCTQVTVRAPEETAHRHLADVLEFVERSGAPRPVLDRASAVFRRIAAVEAGVHGVTADEVHFHEVGGLDSIVDVLGVVAGVHELGYEAVFARPVAVGTGTLEMAHGEYPVPAPATARLLEGMTVRETGYAQECTTPTGAALLAELTGGRGAPAEAVYGRTGFGAGSRNPPDRPNCLRLIECRIPAEIGDGPGQGRQAVYALQADIDDLSPEYVTAARDTLMAAGALDVTTVRVDMKKGRSGTRLEALSPEASLDAVLRAFFAGTSTIGVRYWRVERAVLAREEEVLDWRGHGIRVKRVTLPDGSIRRKPEYDDVAAAARAEGLSPYEVRAELNEEESRAGSGS